MAKIPGVPDDDPCALCKLPYKEHRAKESDKRRGFHEFIPSAKAQDQASSRGPALKQGPLASTLPQPSGDLLESLRDARSRHYLNENGWCVVCGNRQPQHKTCEAARLADVAIGLGEKAQALVDKIDFIETKTNFQAIFVVGEVHGIKYSGPGYGDELGALREALTAAQEKWEGK